MAGLKGDFIGFSFNGKHSSDMGITRVSDGNRYNDNILPTMQDKTATVPGADGTYFFKTNYTQKTFNINFAFDSLTESEYRGLRQWLGDKKPHDLIFDELPYKVYKAKVTGSATIKTICFDSEKDETSLETNIIHNHMLGENTVIPVNKNIERLYKGEGNIQFTAYTPFARSQFKTVEEYSSYNNVNEWVEASGIKSNTEISDVYNSNKNGFDIYNPGDIETDYIITIPFVDNTIAADKLYLDQHAAEYQLEWNDIKAIGNDVEVCINSKLNLIEGWEEKDGVKKKSGNVYNGYITSGYFFKLPITDGDVLILANHKNATIKYDYLYF